ncbi:MAG TPA: hypothetical protein VE046_10950 [Steroidobacteraceae bacterium]|nr:hypothetical protein [Steroidobacteraceae bacterium]
MDAASLYREESFTDRRVGTIRRLTPVTSDGSVDGARSEVFVGQAQLLTPMGAIPLNFEIPASNLHDATQKFSAAAQEAVQRTMQELQELRREQASSIVIPEGGAGSLGGLGSAPGGGKIRMP